MNGTILSVEHLMMHFGGIKALNDVNLDVERGSITALIGPNGAGKTTVFNCLTGFYRPTGGAIVLNAHAAMTDVIQVLGQKIRPDDFLHPARLGSRIYYKMFGGTHLVNRAGLARTFQNIRLFREMSVIENLLVAQHMQVNRNLVAGILNTRGYRKAENQALDRACYWLGVVENTLVFNLVYRHGPENLAYVKRFAMPKFILNREYRLFEEDKRSAILLLLLGKEGLRIRASLMPSARAKHNAVEIDLDDHLIKGVSARGRRIASRAVRRVTDVTNAPRKPAVTPLELPGMTTKDEE